MIRNISIPDAVSALLSSAPQLCPEEVPLSDALSRVLAEDLPAKVDLPPFHRSAYDGFAFRSAETAGASDRSPAVFRITKAITAGDFCPDPPEAGCCVRIMTGAPLPEGTDCVINFECVTQSEDRLFVTQPLHPWQNVDQQGDELRFGAPLLQKGDFLTPFHLGLLASQGYDRIPVFKKPRAAILSTGSELVSPGLALSPGKIYDSNLSVFRALLEQESCHVTQPGHVADEEDMIRSKLCELAHDHDLIVTTGGASVGDKDYICSALEQAGARILFYHVNMKPGSCCFGARLGGSLVISLSGNPGAALTAFRQEAFGKARLSSAGNNAASGREFSQDLPRSPHPERASRNSRQRNTVCSTRRSEKQHADIFSAYECAGRAAPHRRTIASRYTGTRSLTVMFSKEVALCLKKAKKTASTTKRNTKRSHFP